MPSGSRSRSGVGRLVVWAVILALAVTAFTMVRRQADGISVLFVGNSYTYYNDMPVTVGALAESVGVPMTISVIAPGGSFLSDHVIGDTDEVIAGGDFDVVVIQEQSTITAASDLATNSTYPAAARLAEAARASGATVVFFATWGHARGNSEVGQGSYASMQDAITATYSNLGVRLAADVAGVGEAWRRWIDSGSTIPLHSSDGSHPTPAGSYLAASVIAAAITDTNPIDFGYDGGLDAGLASSLREIAGRP